MGKESAERIQTSLLSKAEKKALVWLAQRQPGWMTSDTLTYIGVLGTVIYAIGGWLSNTDIKYLWPVYGFFIDHTLDAVTTCLIFLGAGLSPMFRMDVALAALAGYLSLSIYTYVCTIVKEEFCLTYGKLGPTEFRLLLILLNILYMYTSWSEWHVDWRGIEWGIFDILGILITIILFCIFLVQFMKDRAAFAKQDPLKPYSQQK